MHLKSSINAWRKRLQYKDVMLAVVSSLLYDIDLLCPINVLKI